MIIMGMKVWRFQVKEGHEGDIVRMNQEDWPRLFGRSSGYVGTEINVSRKGPIFYVTADSWTSKVSFDRFVEQYKADFEALSRQHEKHYESAEDLGFIEIGSMWRHPDRTTYRVDSLRLDATDYETTGILSPAVGYTQLETGKKKQAGQWYSRDLENFLDVFTLVD